METGPSEPTRIAPRRIAAETEQEVMRLANRYAREVARIPRWVDAATRRRLVAEASARLQRDVRAVVRHARELVAGEGAFAGRYLQIGRLSWAKRLQLAMIQANRELDQMLADPTIPKVDVARRAATLAGYRVRRVARSEINNAFVERQLSRLAARGVRYVRWITTSGRPCQICVGIATTDAFGLGAGVFPIDAVPEPPHPYCQCARVAVRAVRLAA